MVTVDSLYFAGSAGLADALGSADAPGSAGSADSVGAASSAGTAGSACTTGSAGVAGSAGTTDSAGVVGSAATMDSAGVAGSPSAADSTNSTGSAGVVTTTGIGKRLGMLMSSLGCGGQRSWTRDTLRQAWVKRLAPVRMVMRIDGPCSFRAGCVVLGTWPLKPADRAGAESGSGVGTEGDPGRGSASLWMRSALSGAQLIASRMAVARRRPTSPSSFPHPKG